MKKLNLFALGLVSLSLASCSGETKEETPAVATETYTLDTEMSIINWTGEYFKAGTIDHNHEGILKLNSGSIEIADGIIQSGTFELNMNSIDATGLDEETKAKLIGHLKSDEYFDVAKFPTATVKLRQCTADKLVGTITVKGVEMPFEAPASTTVGDDAVKINGEFTLNFAPYGMEGIGSDADPEYVSPNVKFNIGLRLTK